ncbi:hypothetical protein B0H15DRAFT_952814 [Mycena belliarum]|uniref:Ribonuclease H1 N-terminal domain-containing protein n=1 Tax=Mycena belliarum TaxID=1033014 RepID=A0AAD6TW56_9AGAR|nr:hypothetical protein B0H15DRAFT_952814 [Mycena belliae]
MAHLTTSTTTSSSAVAELEVLLELVARLSVASSEATRLAAELQSKLPMALALRSANSVSWIRGSPKSPTEVEADFPEGSGEVWYVVIRGREPGLYRTADEANAQTKAVPHQFSQKKTSRREATLFYRDNYVASINHDRAPVGAGTNTLPMGVQKWVEVPQGTVV